MSNLEGLKAAAGTTTARPPLRVVFVPRFWGSYESRMENGKNHLSPTSEDRGWQVARAHTLCGKPIASDTYDGDMFPARILGPQDAIPRNICRRCSQIASKRGL